MRFSQVRRPGQWLVDSFPILAKIPLFDLVSGWRRFGAECHRKDSEVWMGFWKQMCEEIDNGTAPHSFGKGFVQSDWASKGLDELQAAYVLGTMIEAGSETTSVQLNNTILGILSRGQEVVQRAHEELDRVVGTERAPTFEDEPNLPYIRAMVKEVMRWRFVNKFGTNHYAMQDGWYKDYFIPKGSVVMINIWGLQWDSSRFEEPEKVSSTHTLGHRRAIQKICRANITKCSMSPCAITITSCLQRSPPQPLTQTIVTTTRMAAVEESVLACTWPRGVCFSILQDCFGLLTFAMPKIQMAWIYLLTQLSKEWYREQLLPRCLSKPVCVYPCVLQSISYMIPFC